MKSLALALAARKAARTRTMAPEREPELTNFLSDEDEMSEMSGEPSELFDGPTPEDDKEESPLHAIMKKVRMRHLGK